MKGTNHFISHASCSDTENDIVGQFAQDSSRSFTSADVQHDEKLTRPSIIRRTPLLADDELNHLTQDSAEDSSSGFEFILDPPVIPRLSFRAANSQQRNTESPTMITDLFTNHMQNHHSRHSPSNNAVFNISAAWFLPISDDFDDGAMSGHRGSDAAPVWRLQPRLSSSHQYAFVVGSCDQVNSV